jgi:2-polyprenyl-3-methyl-5-hydroxy-6-metoxy-1,4-benzoquinol methylase
MPEPSQLRRYSTDDPLTNGIQRGMLFFEGVRDALAIAPAGRTLIDVGCGYGGLSIAWARLGGRAVAIDASPMWASS